MSPEVLRMIFLTVSPLYHIVQISGEILLIAKLYLKLKKEYFEFLRILVVQTLVVICLRN